MSDPFLMSSNFLQFKIWSSRLFEDQIQLVLREAKPPRAVQGTRSTSAGDCQSTALAFTGLVGFLAFAAKETPAFVPSGFKPLGKDISCACGKLI